MLSYCATEHKSTYNYRCMLNAGETCMYPDLTWYPVMSIDGLSTPPAAG